MKVTEKICLRCHMPIRITKEHGVTTHIQLCACTGTRNPNKTKDSK